MAQAMPMPMRPPAMQGTPVPAGMVSQQGPPAMQIPINPAMQTLLDSLPHHPVPFQLATVPVANSTPPQTNTIALCPAHKQPVCETCGVDFTGLNYMHQFLRMAPPEAIPPPPNVQPPPQRAEMIKNMKEQGNVGILRFWI